jgi:hypothetical protein
MSGADKDAACFGRAVTKLCAERDTRDEFRGLLGRCRIRT